MQVFSVNSIKLIFLAVFSTSLTLARASGLISLAEGCGGRGWPAGMILRTAGGVTRMVSGAGAAGCGGAAGTRCHEVTALRQRVQAALESSAAEANALSLKVSRAGLIAELIAELRAAKNETAAAQAAEGKA